jgi:5S rRNA maturation endonuclease (ribonuclease M5)
MRLLRFRVGYAVLAALGLSVADSLLIGCTPIIVEGPSDQHYLGAIKNLLIAAGRLKTGRELIFPPAGGAKTVRAVASILGARDENLPMALFDSDMPGKKLAQKLRSSLYTAAQDRALEVGTFVEMEGAEMEDLIPANLIVYHVDRWQREPEQPFADVYQPGKPIVLQIEAWAAKHQIKLALGWKVEIAMRVKRYLIQ